MSTAVADRAAPSRAQAAQGSREPGSPGGGAIFLISATAVHAGNYVYNLVMGRWLGPAEYAELALIVTMMLVATTATTTLELAAAKQTADVIARGGDPGSVRRSLLRGARWVGGLTALGLAAAAPWLRSVFDSPSVWPLLVFAVGLPLYLVAGVHRGVLHGALRFRRLAGSFQAEMLTRLAIGVALVWLGAGVVGAVIGLSASFVASWLVAAPAAHRLVSPGPEPRSSTVPGSATATIVGAAAVLLVGQVLVANSDVLLVKATFGATEAGTYAAVALIGRAIFFGSWSVVSLTFPFVAARTARGDCPTRLLYATSGSVAVLGGVATAIAAIAPEMVVSRLFGDAYLPAAPLLAGYALATTLFAVANAIVNHDLAAGRTRGVWILLAGGGLQVVALVAHHPTTTAVVDVQVAAMTLLLAAVIVDRARDGRRGRR